MTLRLLDEHDPAGDDDDLLERVCQGYARMAGMRRTAVFLDDGIGGLDLGACYGFPVAARPHLRTVARELIRHQAAPPDVVVLGRNGLSKVPAVAARPLEITTLVCVPMAVANRRVGWLVADRGGQPFHPSPQLRHIVWLAAKQAALVLIVRESARQEQLVRRLSERIELRRRIHGDVVQRLATVALLLRTTPPLAPEELVRCGTELSVALQQLRHVLESAPSDGHHDEDGLRGKLDALAADPAVHVQWSAGTSVPHEMEELVEHFVEEALTNARKHARANAIDIRIDTCEGRCTVEVVNDGVGRFTRPGAGMGRRLLEVDALLQGGEVEFGPVGTGSWLARLVLPGDRVAA